MRHLAPAAPHAARILLLSLLAACGDDAAVSGSVVDAGGDALEGSADAGGDASSDDTGSDDTGSSDTGSDDTGSSDTGSDDTGSSDTSSDDTGIPDTDLADTDDTGPSDTGSADTGPDDTNDDSGLTDTLDDTDPTDTGTDDTGEDADSGDDTGTPGDGGIVWTEDPEAIPTAPDLFELSVQAGAMRSESVLLWTFVADAEPVTLRVWRDDVTTGERLLVREEIVVPNADGYLHAPVDGLLPATWYRYAFFAEQADGLEVRSAVGRVKTAPPAGDLSPVVVAATSCTNARNRPYSALSAMATRADADLFLHLGDQSYNDGNTSLSGFRDAWRSTLVEPGYLALHESMGFYQTWDDHEVDNDYDPTSVPSSVLNAAFQSFYETYAIETGPGGGLWNSYAWGDTAEFIILDSRSERYVPDDSYYISQAQMDFVKQRLSESTAHFKVLLNSVPITDMPTGYFGEGDRWEGYDRQRDELLNHITSNDIRNVWFLSGDFHIGMVTRVNNSGPARRIHEIAVGPGDNSNPAASLLDTLERFSGTDQLIWNTTSFQSSVQTILTFDPGRNQVRIEFREPDGDPIYDVWLSEGS